MAANPSSTTMKQREQDDDLAALAVRGRVGRLGRAVASPRGGRLARGRHHSIRIRTVDAIGIWFPNASGQIMW